MRSPIDVLLVEDDPLSAFNTKHALGRSQDVATIAVAVDGRDALDRLHDGGLDLDRLVIITDLSMPRMSGLELASAVRAEPALRAVPIIVLTSSTDDADRQAALAVPVEGYFVKAATTPHLDEIVARLHALCAADAAAPGP